MNSHVGLVSESSDLDAGDSGTARTAADQFETDTFRNTSLRFLRRSGQELSWVHPFPDEVTPISIDKLKFKETHYSRPFLFPTRIKHYRNALEIKLTEAHDKKLVEEHQLRPDFRAHGVVLPLLDMLQHARKITIIPEGVSGAKGIQLFERLLKKVGNPVPKVESLVIFRPGRDGTRGRDGTGVEQDRDTTRPILDAIISGKLMTLTRLSFSDYDVTQPTESSFSDFLSSSPLDETNPIRVSGAGSLPHLQELCLNLPLVVNDAYMALFHLGSFGRALRVLNLNFSSGGKGGHASLAKAMEAGRLLGLENLSLSGTRMGSADCEAYASCMSSGKLPALRELIFSNNGIGDIGATALSLACRSGNVNRLAVLALSNNAIGDKGLIELANSSETGALSRLTSLYLNFNEFTVESFRALSRVLAFGHLNSLGILGLLYDSAERSKVTSNCAKALVEALARNPGLKCEIYFDWPRWPDMDRLRQRHQERNSRVQQILAGLSPTVPATFGKVYLCGNPEVGKTTLRKSLMRGYLKSVVTKERRPYREERTRGIAVSKLFSEGKQGDQSVQLAVWDMAGQQEYHMIHNAFFPDLAFAQCNATSFVVMSRHQDAKVAQQELEYWLQFIASSCGESVLNLRKVFVVLNCFEGDSEPHLEDWKSWLHLQSTQFGGYLAIETTPFIIDVRTYRQVKQLKQRLIDHTREMLRNEKVPDICLVIEKILRTWREENTDQFPIMKWQDFVKKVGEMEGFECPERTLEEATKYLSEAGILLYIPIKKLVILSPEWFCTDILGKMFLPNEMSSFQERVFRSEEVNKEDGSVSVSKLTKFFMHMHKEWTSSQVEDLMAILVWLGLCYVRSSLDQNQKIVIPAFIENSSKCNQEWESHNLLAAEHVEGQWVMGYTVEHEKNPIALASIALWHRFQAELGQRPEYNGKTGWDSDFVLGRYDIFFNINYMHVWINVDASEDHPTFQKIDIFVKPLLPIAGEVIQDPNTRKECQVDLASSLVDILLDLWKQVCPRVGYVHRVVWPWPVYCSRQIISRRNMEVSEVLKFVEENGLGMPMQWKVGNDSIAMEQLLSKSEFNSAVKSMQENDNVVQECMREAVELGIFPPLDFKDKIGGQESYFGRSGKTMLMGDSLTESDLGEISRKASTGDEYIGEVQKGKLPRSEISREVLAGVEALISGVIRHLEDLKIGQSVLRDVMLRNLQETKEVRYALKKVMKLQRDNLQKVEQAGRFLLEDRERSCPRFIYVGVKNSGKWVALKKLKESISPMEKVHLHFLCEAQYDNHRQHPVEDQEGIDVSRFRDWAEKLLPWLKASVTVLLISTKVAANLVAPGLGIIFPNSVWQQASLISDGIALATGYSKTELDELSNKGTQAGAKSTPKSPQELQGPIRKAMTELLRNLTLPEYEKKLGLQKVRLQDDSFDSVVWICKDCYKKYGPNRITDIG